MHSFAMKSPFVFLIYFVGLAVSLPIRREVPQEHSHNLQVASVRNSLNVNNPSNLGDPIFPLLGNAAAAQGLGDTTDPDCLQQAVADQAFTNAKAANDIDGQVSALIYRALERNSGKVGLASAPCTSTQAVNPETAAIQQHQDPASTNATAINKAIVLELAKQIASVGGDPQDALKSGTFAPGDVNDPTAAGNTCDDANDEQGCIFTQNLLVPDATPEEIQAAVADGPDATNNTGVSGSSSTVNSSDVDAAGDSNTTAPAGGNGSSISNNTGDDANDGQDISGASTANTNSTSGQNLQTFTGDLGGIAPPPVTPGGRGFVVEGDDFTGIQAALGRSCDVQHNQCANLANSADGQSLGLTTSQCDQQNQSCKAASTAASASDSTGNGKAVGNGGIPGNGKGKVNNNGGMGQGKANGHGVGGGNGNVDAPESSANESAVVAGSDTNSSDSTSTQNLQTFAGALGDISPPAVTAGGRGFVVQDSDEFVNVEAALGRSCDIQHNKCANLANSAAGKNSGLTTGQCDQQDTACRAAATAAT